MEIRLLKTFVMIARLKNFSAAARELNTVQPAVSKQIGDLERELGCKLFLRTTRQVSLTAAGEALLDEAIEILEQEKRAKARVARAAKGQIGRLRIGYLGPACHTFLPDLVRSYLAKYPQVQVQLKEMTAQEQLIAFEEEQLDICLSRPLPEGYGHGVQSEVIYIDQLAAFLPENHSLADRSRISLEDLKSEQFVIFSRKESKGIFDQIISSCRKAGFSPDISSQPESMQTVLTEVASGLGVSLAPSSVRNLSIKGCVCVPVRDPIDSIPLVVQWRSDIEHPIVEAFAKIAISTKENIQNQMDLV